MDYASILMSESVHISDKKQFNVKIGKLKSNGPDHMQCVFDFDATISKATHRGKKVLYGLVYSFE